MQENCQPKFDSEIVQITPAIVYVSSAKPH